MQCFSTNIWDMVFIVAEQPPPSRQSSQQNASGTTYLTSVARLRAQASLEARLTGYTVTSQIRGGPTRNAKDLLPIKLVLDRCPQVRTFLGSTRWTFPGCLLWIFNVMALWLLCPASEAMLNHMKPQVNYIFYFTDILCILVCFTHT